MKGAKTHHKTKDTGTNRTETARTQQVINMDSFTETISLAKNKSQTALEHLQTALVNLHQATEHFKSARTVLVSCSEINKTHNNGTTNPELKEATEYFHNTIRSFIVELRKIDVHCQITTDYATLIFFLPEFLRTSSIIELLNHGF